MRASFSLFLTAALAACAAPVTSAGPSADDPGGHVPVPAELDLMIGTSSLRDAGPTECRLDRNASIAGHPASHFSVRHDTAHWQLMLDLWQVRDGAPDVIRLRVSVPPATYEVDTAEPGGHGSATIGFERVRLGGTMSIRAVAADGTTIVGTVACSRFTGIVAQAPTR